MSENESMRMLDDEQLIDRAGEGDVVALAELFGRYRKRLRQMVRPRLDRRLQGRVDASDVLQEAYLDVAQQLLLEELTNAEVAEVLGLEISTASTRYIRALKRLQVMLEQVPGLFDRVR
jgi:RNA polymerase sigma-70 factor (ECF subfamily)